MQPKVFISYSWSNQSHQELVQHWAERLIGDGIEVILDIYDLKEGHDKYAFMERMITDSSVTNVLVICDKKYTEKADLRKAGVGTESQIISQEVYDKVEQSKFIPIVCKFDENGQPYLPIYLKSRIWINFSSPEAVNENWERLIRLLYGKPLHVKPKLGKEPTYITTDIAIPTSETLTKFNSLKQAIFQDKKGIDMYRRDFLDACLQYADELRVRERPTVDSIGAKILEDVNKLKVVRDYLVNWVLLESESLPKEVFAEVLVEVLERLRELKSRPAELNSWNDSWSEAHSVFVYETFLYIVAALLKTQSYKVLHEIYTTHYLKPMTNRYGQESFESFDAFYGYSETLQSVLAPDGRRLYSPAAELLKRNADREDLPFSDIMQAELLTLMMSFIIPGTRWYPQTLHYSQYGSGFPFFIRSEQHRFFLKLSIITGIDDADELRKKVKEGHERLGVNYWYDFHFERNFWSSMNMDKLDKLK